MKKVYTKPLVYRKNRTTGKGEELLKVSQEMIIREIAGEKILIPVGATALKVHGMGRLSESGLLLWNRMQMDCTRKELVDALLSEYQIDRGTAEKDVDEFLEQIREAGLLTE